MVAAAGNINRIVKHCAGCGEILIRFEGRAVLAGNLCQTGTHRFRGRPCGFQFIHHVPDRYRTEPVLSENCDFSGFCRLDGVFLT
ncbi:hypothetical protein SDC9_206565 [bioreactor metagenome]|uniref:Uncharacterized protein n=1 Tax=bioreactor metagenome TaxID=1076179 RepID=A0A645J830_9ZZZZ